jgi:uncharacterized protein YjdB
MRQKDCQVLHPAAHAAPRITQYTLNQIKSIYGFPEPTGPPIVVGVVSFGGGLIGSLTGRGPTTTIAGIPTRVEGTLTRGDVISQWTSLGIATQNQPRVIVVSLNRASTRANPNDIATIENTMDVATIGGLCPTSNLTIILYVTNPYDNFPQIIPVMMNPINVNGTSYTPSIISCSWGAPEIYYTAAELNTINNMFQVAAARGITITTATGDNGSYNGTNTATTDFPSSSPYVVACGGTTLFCDNSIYDETTIETAWSNGGGGISKHFSKPVYQQFLSGGYRCTPDIVLVSDPNTGVLFSINGVTGPIGGTSFASPAVAAFVAALNLKTALTPLIYAAQSSCFHDITIGSNGHYSATINYDNCTGRGSIVGPLFATAIQGPPPPLVTVTDVSLNGMTSVTVGATTQLTATITPANATNKSVSFLTDNTSVASVSALGLVTGNAPGSALITVTTVDGELTASTLITVNPVRVVRVILPASVNVNINATSQLNPVIAPTNATTKTVTYTSSNPDVASISISGLITGTSAGSATITATSTDGGLIARTRVSVSSIRVKRIQVTPTSGSLRIGNRILLTVKVTPTNATNPAVIWGSSAPTIASVINGTVTANTRGTATITARTVDGNLRATCRISVTPN